jgi:hypothetical protein
LFALKAKILRKAKKLVPAAAGFLTANKNGFRAGEIAFGFCVSETKRKYFLILKIPP